MTRTYSDGITYDAVGRMKEERFSTQTPLYHKLHYNVRGQLYDVRLSTVPWAADQWNWNRGALVNYYSNQGGWVPGGSGADNSDNVKLAQHWVPADAQISSSGWMNQYYDYDALSRLSYVKEQQNGADYTGEQHYTYDRWATARSTPQPPTARASPSHSSRWGRRPRRTACWPRATCRSRKARVRCATTGRATSRTTSTRAGAGAPTMPRTE